MTCTRSRARAHTHTHTHRCCVADIVDDVMETKYRIPRMSTDVVYQYVTAESNSVIREVHLQVEPSQVEPSSL